MKRFVSLQALQTNKKQIQRKEGEKQGSMTHPKPWNPFTKKKKIKFNENPTKIKKKSRLNFFQIRQLHQSYTQRRLVTHYSSFIAASSVFSFRAPPVRVVHLAALGKKRKEGQTTRTAVRML